MKRFAAKVENKKLIVFAQSAFQVHVESMEGERVDVSVIKHKDKRTTDQNSYYWWILKFISDETGHSSEDLHELFKSEFLADKIEILGKQSNKHVTTTKLNTKEMTDYIEKVRRFMMEWGLYIPEANELDYIY